MIAMTGKGCNVLSLRTGNSALDPFLNQLGKGRTID